MPALLACGRVSEWSEPTGRPHPTIVVGIDGGEWRVIRALWDQGRLPALRQLAEKGAQATLRTNYGESPVIWTTMATGVSPERHGITGFVVPSPMGDVPVSSKVRRVPALWNMASAAGRRVAVLGWWASWPAEKVNGVVVSDRATRMADHSIYPAERQKEFLRLAGRPPERPRIFGGEWNVEKNDLLMAAVAEKLAEEDFDLLLVYFRSVDVTSHSYWKYFDPEKFERVDEEELVIFRDRIPSSYEAIDRVVARLMEVSSSQTNIYVISDHGFRAKEKEDFQIGIDFDLILEHFGFLELRDGTVDCSQSLLYTFDSPDHARAIQLRWCLEGREVRSILTPEKKLSIQSRLDAALETIRWANGAKVFRVRAATPSEGEKGVDLVVEVSSERATRQIFIDGQSFEEGIKWLQPLSGGHDKDTHGIFIAAGPDIRPGAAVAGIGIHDMTPTLLYAMGLPVAEDFDGRPRTDLFTEGFQASHPLRSIPSWGSKKGEALASPADKEIIEELRSLGYLN